MICEEESTFESRVETGRSLMTSAEKYILKLQGKTSETEQGSCNTERLQNGIRMNDYKPTSMGHYF